MSRKRKRKSKSLSDRITYNRRAASEVKNGHLELQTWADLPAELLELIFSQLVVADNVRASVVCKSWHSVANSVRVVDQSPWLMYFPKFGSCYDFYDPVERKIYSLELPELDKSCICYTKDGWLLLHRRRQWATNHNFSLFNPFTRELIKLPILDRTYHIAAFSCAPTSTGCVILTFKHVSPSVVAINTCYPGAKEWTTADYQNLPVFVCSIWNKLIFSNGLFYCLSLTGWLGVFDPIECTWSILGVPPPKCLESLIAKNWWKGKFMTEHAGNIFVIHINYREDPIIFKLDKTLMEWKEVKTLDGVTLFASLLSSHSRTYISGKRNSIYFSKVRFYGKRCISFSLDDQRYYPSKQCNDWVEPDVYENIWIEPPKDFDGWM